MSSAHHDEFPGVDYPKINRDVLRSLTETSPSYYILLGVLGLIVLAGAGVYYYQTVYGLGVWGVNEPNYWGLDLPTFIFWIGFSLSGTLLSAILLLTKSHWRNAVYRVAELSTGFALMTAGLVVFTHMGRPWRFWYTMPYPNMRFLWTNFRSPLTADILGMVSYLTASMLFLIVGSIPDFAALRDHTTGWRKKLYTVLAFGWKGTDEQWRHFRRAYLLIACFIIPVAISMHTVTSWVPSMTINPGTRSTIFPLYFVTGALLSGVGGVIMLAILVRKYLKFEAYIQPRHLDHLGKLLLLASMLITYIYVIEIFVPSYKAENFEYIPLLAKLAGKYSLLYWTMILFNAVIPLSLFSRRVRRNTTTLFLIAGGVQIGMYLERILMIIPTQTVGPLPSTWNGFSPTWVEFALLFWELSLFAFLMLGSVKIIPAVSIFEVKELLPIPKRSDGRVAQRVGISGPAPAQPLDTFGQEPSTATLRPIAGYLATFSYLDDALKAYEQLKQVGVAKLEIQSPIPSHEIDEATLPQAVKGFSPAAVLRNLRDRKTHVVRFSAGGAVAGLAGMALVAGGTAIDYPIQGGGLPIISLPAVAWSSAVFMCLAGVIGSVVGLFVLAKLPSYSMGAYTPAATKDKFVVAFSETEGLRAAAGRAILQNCGADAIEEAVD